MPPRSLLVVAVVVGVLSAMVVVDAATPRRSSAAGRSRKTAGAGVDADADVDADAERYDAARFPGAPRAGELPEHMPGERRPRSPSSRRTRRSPIDDDVDDDDYLPPLPRRTRGRGGSANSARRRRRRRQLDDDNDNDNDDDDDDDDNDNNNNNNKNNNVVVDAGDDGEPKKRRPSSSSRRHRAAAPEFDEQAMDEEFRRYMKRTSGGKRRGGGGNDNGDDDGGAAAGAGATGGQAPAGKRRRDDDVPAAFDHAPFGHRVHALAKQDVDALDGDFDDLHRMKLQRAYNATLVNKDLPTEVKRLSAHVRIFWQKELHALVAHGVADGMRVLDYGCGPGVFAAQLLDKFPSLQLTCVDPDERLIKVADKRLQVHKRSGRARTLVGEAGKQAINGEQLELGDDATTPFDVVVLRHVMRFGASEVEGLDDELVVASELKSHLRNGGLFVVIDTDDQATADVLVPPFPALQRLAQLRHEHDSARSTRDVNKFMGRELAMLLDDLELSGVTCETLTVHSALSPLPFSDFERQVSPERFAQIIGAASSIDDDAYERILTEWRTYLTNRPAPQLITTEWLFTARRNETREAELKERYEREQIEHGLPVQPGDEDEDDEWDDEDNDLTPPTDDDDNNNNNNNDDRDEFGYARRRRSRASAASKKKRGGGAAGGGGGGGSSQKNNRRKPTASSSSSRRASASRRRRQYDEDESESEESDPSTNAETDDGDYDERGRARRGAARDNKKKKSTPKRGSAKRSSKRRVHDEL